MGRGKIEIKKIENANSRQVTFSKRRAGLLKKANELAVLCEADVAVIIFSNTGKSFEFCSSSMETVLSRYHNLVESKVRAIEFKPQKKEPKEVDVLKEELENLKSKQQRLLGKELTGMDLDELQTLENQLNEGLLCIKERKEQILMQKLTETTVQGKHTMLENETLFKQVKELGGFPPSASRDHPVPLCLEYRAVSNRDPAVKEGSGSHETGCNGVLADEESDTTLQLGPPSGVRRKRKVSDSETQSSNTGSQAGRAADPFLAAASSPTPPTMK